MTEIHREKRQEENMKIQSTMSTLERNRDENKRMYDAVRQINKMKLKSPLGRHRKYSHLASEVYPSQGSVGRSVGRSEVFSGFSLEYFNVTNFHMIFRFPAEK